MQRNIETAMDPVFVSLEAAAVALGGSIDYLRMGLDEDAGQCLNFETDPFVVAMGCVWAANELFGCAVGEQVGSETQHWFLNEDDYRRAGESYALMWRGETYNDTLHFKRRDDGQIRRIDTHRPPGATAFALDREATHLEHVKRF